jgi:SAM-dependent methyltransferase
VAWPAIVDLLVDPDDCSQLTFDPVRSSMVSATGRTYAFVRDQPVLLPQAGFRSDGWLFPPTIDADGERVLPTRSGRTLVKRYQNLIRGLVGGQGAGGTFVDLVRDQRATVRPRVLVVGGATVGDGCAELIDAPDVDVISFDVYATPDTTFVADAHRIPLSDCSVDGAWIQAVLEHVYRPGDVVAELARVLRPAGLLYAETPFLQPVHEGAFDYVRFTRSGHRMLFARFDEIASGSLGGPAAVVHLGLRGLVGGVSRSQTLARLAYVLTHPLVLLDRLVPPAWRSDFATGSFFLGRLRDDASPTFDAISEYRKTQ